MVPEYTVNVPEGILGLLWAAKEIQSIELAYDQSPGGPKKKVRTRLRAISKQFGLASREMSLVAVVSFVFDTIGAKRFA